MKTNLLKKTVTIAGLIAIWMTALGFAGHADRAAAAASPVVNPDSIISTGKKYLGVKYRFGAPSNVAYAFDCSSFTQYVFKQHGVTLPRTSTEQSKRGAFVAKASLQKGDLVFFRDPGRPQRIGHVAVYAGNNTMLGASGKAVKFSSMTSSYWTKNYVTARRVITPSVPKPVNALPVLKLPAADKPAAAPASVAPTVAAPAETETVAEQPTVETPAAETPALPAVPAIETPAVTVQLSTNE